MSYETSDRFSNTIESVSRLIREDEARKFHKAARNKYYRIRFSAFQRGIEFDLLFEDYEPLHGKSCHYCNSDSTGLDRIDSDGGYTLDNVVPCCKHCNYAKGSRSTKDFMEHIKRVYEYNFLRDVK